MEKRISESLQRFRKRTQKNRTGFRETLGNNIVSKAAAYCLNELESIYNIITDNNYDLDNNMIERPMRYISISRRNSLFCCSNNGATRTAMLYSIAISCRLNNVNTFSYFKDVIQCLAENQQMKQPMAEIITETHRSMTVIFSHPTNERHKNLDR